MPALAFPLAVIDTGDHAVLALLALLALAFALGVAEKVVTMFRAFRKDPPDHEVYATKHEVEEFEARISRDVAELKAGITSRLDKIDATIGAELRSINRALGRLEGSGTD